MTSSPSGSGDHLRLLADGAGAEDRDLGLVDDRGVEQGARAADVGDREGAAGQLVRADLVVAGAGGEVGDVPGEAGDVQLVGVRDHRDEQAARGVDRDGQVHGPVVGHLLALLVDRGVELRVLLERLDRRLREERQVGQLDALAALELGLGLRAQPGDAGDVDLLHGGQLGRHPQRLGHPLGDHLAQPRQLDRAARLGGALGRGGLRAAGRPADDAVGGSRSAAAGAACFSSPAPASGRGLLGGGEDVLLADPAAHPGTRDRWPGRRRSRRRACGPAASRTGPGPRRPPQRRRRWPSACCRLASASLGALLLAGRLGLAWARSCFGRPPAWAPPASGPPARGRARLLRLLLLVVRRVVCRRRRTRPRRIRRGRRSPPARPRPRTVSSSSAVIDSRVPATGEGISVSTLSVDTSSSGSSTSTESPTCLSQRVTVPSVTLSPSSGIVTGVPEPPDFFLPDSDAPDAPASFDGVRLRVGGGLRGLVRVLGRRRAAGSASASSSAGASASSACPASSCPRSSCPASSSSARPPARLAAAAGPVAVADHGQVAADLDGLVLARRRSAPAPPRRGTGSRCRPCRWRPRAAARRPRPGRPPA